jgi:hypothetical protein
MYASACWLCEASLQLPPERHAPPLSAYRRSGPKDADAVGKGLVKKIGISLSDKPSVQRDNQSGTSETSTTTVVLGRIRRGPIRGQCVI